MYFLQCPKCNGKSFCWENLEIPAAPGTQGGTYSVILVGCTSCHSILGVLPDVGPDFATVIGLLREIRGG
jgi:hypothetical protein